ncbi:MAG TPA: zf-HC2 domain-containing protein [Planctomycetota bacterium]|nr:zf-HC2 domain-containing protein [Planctomycetota bacterium]
MNCADAAERITALVDGELPPGERAELERHLAECGACRDARAAEEAIAARVRGLGRPPLPDGFREAVLDRVRAEPAPGAVRPSGRIIPLGPWLTAGAAAAAAALAMVYFGGGDRAGGPVATLAPAEKSPRALDEANYRGRAADLEGRAARDKGPGAEDGAVEFSRPEAKPERPDQTGGAPAPGPAPAPPTTAQPAAPARPPKAPAPAPALPPETRQPETPTDGGAVGGKDGAGGRSGGSETPPADEAKKKRANESGLAAAEEERRDPQEDDDSGARVKSEEVERQRKQAVGDREVRRLALFFRAPGGPSAERDIDRVLLAHRELALETVGWRDASTLDTASGRALKSFAAARDREGDGFARMETPGAAAGRVIQVRLRARDLDRVREALGKAESVREAGSLLLLDLESRDLGEVELGALAGFVSPPAPDGGGAKPGAAAPPATAGGTPAPKPTPTPEPAPAEPAPPPPPSGKALEKLARGVEPAPRPVTDPAKEDGAAEVWLEIHLLGEPSPR